MRTPIALAVIASACLVTAGPPYFGVDYQPASQYSYPYSNYSPQSHMQCSQFTSGQLNQDLASAVSYNAHSAQRIDLSGVSKWLSNIQFQQVKGILKGTFPERSAGYIIYGGHAAQSGDYNRQMYYLRSFHIHAPSQHTMNGQYADMEVHVVCQNYAGERVVLGVMFKVSGHSDKFLTNLAKSLGQVSRGYGTSLSELKLSTLFKNVKDFDYFWAYTGPMAVQPCTTSVVYVISQRVLGISPHDLNQFRAQYSMQNVYMPGMSGYGTGGYPPTGTYPPTDYSSGYPPTGTYPPTGYSSGYPSPGLHGTQYPPTGYSSGYPSPGYQYG